VVKDCYAMINDMRCAELWAWPHSLSSVVFFFSKIKPKENSNFPL